MFQSTSQKTNIALYADDTKIWREIQWSEDHFALQKDIDALHQWSLENKMKSFSAIMRKITKEEE